MYPDSVRRVTGRSRTEGQGRDVQMGGQTAGRQLYQRHRRAGTTPGVFPATDPESGSRPNAGGRCPAQPDTHCQRRPGNALAAASPRYWTGRFQLNATAVRHAGRSVDFAAVAPRRDGLPGLVRAARVARGKSLVLGPQAHYRACG
ncbi:hypothetical protein D3C80_1331930 [compost metagenome]